MHTFLRAQAGLSLWAHWTLAYKKRIRVVGVSEVEV